MGCEGWVEGGPRKEIWGKLGKRPGGLARIKIKEKEGK
jgi:hypothetical protein